MLWLGIMEKVTSARTEPCLKKGAERRESQITRGSHCSTVSHQGPRSFQEGKQKIFSQNQIFKSQMNKLLLALAIGLGLLALVAGFSKSNIFFQLFKWICEGLQSINRFYAQNRNVVSICYKCLKVVLEEMMKTNVWVQKISTKRCNSPKNTSILHPSDTLYYKQLKKCSKYKLVMFLDEKQRFSFANFCAFFQVPFFTHSELIGNVHKCNKIF